VLVTQGGEVSITKVQAHKARAQNAQLGAQHAQIGAQNALLGAQQAQIGGSKRAARGSTGADRGLKMRRNSLRIVLLGVTVRLRVAKLARERGLTAYRMAKAARLPLTTAHRLVKRGAKVDRIDMRTIERLCVALHCEPGDLFERR